MDTGDYTISRPLARRGRWSGDHRRSLSSGDSETHSRARAALSAQAAISKAPDWVA